MKGSTRYPKVRRLTERRSQILDYLSLNGPSNIYQTSKGAEMPFSTTHASIKYLEKVNLVKLGSQGLSKKGVPTKVYELTLSGLLQAIRRPWSKRLTSKEVDRIASYWGHLLPLILGKWNYFKERGLKKRFLDNFDQAIYEDLEGTPWTILAPISDQATRLTIRMLLNPSFRPLDLYYLLDPNEHPNYTDRILEEDSEWFKALREDPEIHTFVLSYLEWLDIVFNHIRRVGEKLGKSA